MHWFLRSITPCAIVATLAISTACPVIAAESYITYILDQSAPRTTLTNFAGTFAASGPSFSDKGVPGGTISVGGQSGIGFAKATSTGSGAGYSGGLYSGWKDVLTFSSAGRTGEHVYVTYALGFDWKLAGTTLDAGSSHSQAFVDLNFSNTAGTRYQYATVSQEIDCSGSSCTTSALSAYRTGGAVSATFVGDVAYFTMDAVYGQSYDFNAAINSFVEGTNSTAMADASHSLTWKGITRAVDSSGAAVSFAVTSASGFNYAAPFVAAPVPEPSQFALLLSGLVAVGEWARRRTSPRPGSTM